MDKKEKIPKEAYISFIEFEKAWQEFFKDKPEPTNDYEERKEQEEFYHWYNNIRKQSDTGKTPAEMYKDVYGKEPEENPIEPSRMMNFEWDEYEDSDDEEDEDEEFEKIADVTANMVTETNFEEAWKDIKKEQKELKRKELSKEMYYAGAYDMFCLMSEGLAKYGDKFSSNDEDEEDDDEEFDDSNEDNIE
jgi:hypothetical protein